MRLRGWSGAIGANTAPRFMTARIVAMYSMELGSRMGTISPFFTSIAPAISSARAFNAP